MSILERERKREQAGEEQRQKAEDPKQAPRVNAKPYVGLEPANLEIMTRPEVVCSTD